PDRLDRVLPAQGAPRVMNRLAEVGSRGFATQLRPEPLHQLLPVQSMLGGERKELDQIRAPAVPPGLGLDGPAVHLDLESTEEPHRASSAHGQLDDSADGERSGNESPRDSGLKARLGPAGS